MTREIKHLILEMSVGMLCYTLVLGVLAWIFHLMTAFQMMPVFTGLAAGFIADVLMLIHMAYITELVADSMDEAYANKTTLIHAMIRKVVFIIALVFLGTRPWLNPVAMIFGAFGLKAGALLQPFVHRAFTRGADTN